MNFPALGDDAVAHKLIESLEYARLADHLFARAERTANQTDILKALGSLLLGKSYIPAKQLAAALRSSTITQTPELARHIFYAYALGIPVEETSEVLQELVRMDRPSAWLTALQRHLDEDIRTTLLAINDCSPKIISITRDLSKTSTAAIAIQCRECGQAYGVPIGKTVMGNTLIPCWHCAHPYVMDYESIPNYKSHLTERETHTLSSIDHVQRLFA